MKCENHSDRIAATSCQNCGTPLCDQCAVYMENGSVRCESCSLLDTLKHQHQETQDKLLAKQEDRLRIAEKRKRQILIRKTVLYSFVLIAAFVSLRVFHQLNMPKNTEINLSDHNDAMLYTLDQAIYDFTQDNSGALPHRLTDLIGRYLPPGKVGRNTLAKFSYEKGTPPSYRIRLKRNIEDPMAGMIITDEGFEIE